MSTMTTSTATDARVWIGCLACYNAGRLVGEWYDAADADAVSIEALHIDAETIARVSCEEMWVMDHEGLPISGECSPMEAAAWGRLLADVDEWQRDAFLAWVRLDWTGNDLPNVSDFLDAYMGEWDSMRDYADNLMDECGMWAEVPEWARPYIDMDAFARDLSLDHGTAPALGGGVYVFRSI